MIGAGRHAAQVKAECGECNVAALGNNSTRKKHVESLKEPVEWGKAVSGKAVTYTPIKDLGVGLMLLAGAIVGVGARVGCHCIINHNAVVDHDAELGDFVHVAPGARVLGAAKVGEGAFIGSNASVMPKAIVPPWAIVRANSVYPNDYLRGIHKLRLQTGGITEPTPLES